MAYNYEHVYIYPYIKKLNNFSGTDKLLTQNVSKLHTSVTLLLNDTGHYGCVWVRAKTVAGFGPKTMGKMFNVTGNTFYENTPI